MDLIFANLIMLLMLYIFISYVIVGIPLYNKRELTTGDIALWLVSPFIFPVVLFVAVRFWYQDRYGEKGTKRGVIIEAPDPWKNPWD